MRTEEEAYQQLREWGIPEDDARAIVKGLYAWANKPDEDESLNDKEEK